MSDLPDWKNKLPLDRARTCQTARTEAEQALQAGARGIWGVRRVTNLVRLDRQSPLGSLKASVRGCRAGLCHAASLVDAASGHTTDLAEVAAVLRPWAVFEF
jgi:hypothetical protein